MSSSADSAYQVAIDALLGQVPQVLDGENARNLAEAVSILENARILARLNEQGTGIEFVDHTGQAPGGLN